MKKFLSIAMVFCLILGLTTMSDAAAKKSARKKASPKQNDKVTQIFKEYPPANATNAQIVRDILKKHRMEHILIIAPQNDGSIGFVMVSVKNGGERDIIVNEGSLPLGSNSQRKKYCSVLISAIPRTMDYNLRFYDASGKFLADGDVVESVEFSDMLDEAVGGYEATLPVILIY